MSAADLISGTQIQPLGDDPAPPPKRAKTNDHVESLSALENLPDKMLLICFSFLPHLTPVALTSKRFERLLSSDAGAPEYPCCERGEWCHEEYSFLRLDGKGGHMWTCCEERMMDPGCLHENDLPSYTSLEDRQAEDDQQRNYTLGVDSDEGELDIGGYDSEDWCADNCDCGYYGGGQPYCLSKMY